MLLSAPALFTLAYAREFLAADSALDGGASYDYRSGRADSAQSHPFIPFAERHSTRRTVAAWSSLGAAGYAVALAVAQTIRSAIFAVGSLPRADRVLSRRRRTHLRPASLCI